MDDDMNRGGYIPPMQAPAPQPAAPAGQPAFIPPTPPTPPPAPQQYVPPQPPQPVTPPPPQPPYPGAPAMNQTFAPAPKGKGLGAILVVFLVLLLLGAAGAAAYYFLMGKRPEPKTVIYKMLTNVEKADSVSLSMKVRADATGLSSEGGPTLDRMTLTLDVSGDVDASVASTTKARMDLGIGFSGASKDLGSADGFLKLGAITLDPDAYVSIKDFSVNVSPTQPNPAVSGMVGFVQGFVSSLKGRWIKVDMEDVPQDTAETARGKALSERLQRMDYVVSIAEGKDQKLPDGEAYHYVVKMDPAKLTEIVREAVAAAAEDKGTFVPASEVDGLAIAPASGSTIDVDLWIGKTDLRLYKAEAKNIVVRQDGQQGDVAVSVELAFSNYGKKLSIDAPAEFTTVEELQGSIMGSLLGASSTPTTAPAKTPAKKAPTRR